MTMSRHTPAVLASAAVAALALAGCGSSSSNSSSTPAGGAAPASQNGAAHGKPSTRASTATAGSGAVALSANASGLLKFNVTTLHAKAGTVTVKMTNPAGSGVAHGIAVQGNGVDKDSKIVQSGSTATVTVSLKAGTYVFYCPVPGHEGSGMKGTLVVT